MVILYDICKKYYIDVPIYRQYYIHRASLFKTMHHLVFSIPKKSDEMDV